MVLFLVGCKLEPIKVKIRFVIVVKYSTGTNPQPLTTKTKQESNHSTAAVNMSAIDMDSIVPVEDRLAVVRKAVRKATEEALKQVALAGSSNESSVQFSDPNASFNLGMELFGQDVTIVQKNIREKLDQVEKNLKDVSQQIARQASSALTEDQENNDPVDETAGKSKAELAQEAGQLSKKINFLRQCSLARSYLDESITLSKPGLSSDPDWVEAARRLARAEEALNEAQNLLVNDEKQKPESKDSPALIAGYKILDSIHASVRRERVDLMDRAKALFDICVTFTEHEIAIRGAQPLKESAKNGLQAAYDVLEALSPDPTNSALKDTLRQFTTRFYRQVLKPVLELTTKTGIGVGASTEKNESLEWRFEDTIDDNDSTLRTGRFKIKGPVCRLQWTRHTGKTPSSTLPNMKNESVILENWKQALNFCHRTMEFVHLHVLMERESLCNQVGNQLFGKPSAMPSTLNLEVLGLESCMIGGNDNGLLMESLVDSLAKTCIPKKLDPDEMPKLQASKCSEWATFTPPTKMTCIILPMCPCFYMFVVAEMLRSFTHPFVQTLVEMQFIIANEDGDNHETRLEKFSSNFEQKYIDNRRCKILNEARNILLNNDYHNTVVTGVDVHARREKDEILRSLDSGMEVFELAQSSISCTASKLLALCKNTMDEAVDHAAARKDEDKDTPMALLPPSLYRAARESLDLYRAVIPATYGKEVLEVPRTAAVFHNDCVFLQYHCLWLGLEYKAKLPPVPKDSNDARATLFHQTFSFLDMVPLFREMADRAMGDMLQRQSQQILDLVGQRITLFGQALRSDEILAEWSEAESALSAGLYHLRHLSETWKRILSHDVFVRSVGYLADTLFTLYLDQVTKAADISESACHFVSSLFQKATSTLEEVLAGDKSGSLVWSRFEAVGRFMDMTLLDIQTGLADGVFRTVTAPALTSLIKATFAESEKRRRLLEALASS